MGLDYSYSQPSQDETFEQDQAQLHEALIHQQEALIQQDQAHAFVYPPQPEVEFGFPQICYCGSEPKIATSSIEPDRRYYTCRNANDGECHVWKWWDEVVMEEMRARDRHTLQLAEKVNSMTFFNDQATEQKLVRLENMGNTIDRRTNVRNRQAHRNLKNDLIENIWTKFGHLSNNM
ncbi:hypothetical protein Bca101_007435 [Brassica carinata]